MGTRNLTVVIKDNEIKLSQYGQWDGYFSYSGKKFLEFVKSHLQHESEKTLQYQIEKFGERIDVLEKVDKNYYDTVIKLQESCGTNPSKNSSKYAIPFNVMLPQFSRDTGVEILNIIHALEPFDFGEKFKFPIGIDLNDSFCEFINIINLDAQEIYMLTSHDFKGETLNTCEIVEKTFHEKCWYKSEIRNIPSIEEVQKYKESIELDYYQRDDGEWVSY